MPLYDYRCTACDREVEVMHGIHATGPEACEACGGPMVKVLSPPAIHFKGSGWAKKDAAAASSKKATPKASSSSSPTDAAGSSTEDKSSAPGSSGKPAADTSSSESKSSAASKTD